MDPFDWGSIREACQELLTPKVLEEYQQLFDDEEDLQMEWEAAVEHPALGVSPLIGQLDDEDLWARNNKDNFHNTSLHDMIKKKFFIAYHQVEAHKRFLKENPEEVAHFQRFQVWYEQQVAGGHAPWGNSGFWAGKKM